MLDDFDESSKSRFIASLLRQPPSSSIKNLNMELENLIEEFMRMLRKLLRYFMTIHFLVFVFAYARNSFFFVFIINKIPEYIPHTYDTENCCLIPRQT